MDLKALAEAVARIPAVNVHIHSRGHGECRPLSAVMPFVTRLYVGRMLPFADAATAARVDDESLDDRERWRAFLDLWPLVRHTGFGDVLCRMLDGWGVSRDLSGADYDAILERLAARSPEMSRGAFAAAGVSHSISNIIGHSDREWESIEDLLAGRLAAEPGFYDLLSTVPLHTFTSRADVLAMSRVSGVDISSLSGAERAVDSIIERAAAKGIVGLKNHCAYRRGLDVGPVDCVRAERELAALLCGGHDVSTLALSDALFHRIAERAADFDLPVAIHAGMLAASAHPRTNVALMAGVFEAHPKTRFDLYHLNYPWIEDLIAILKRFPNTWADCAWTQALDPFATVEFLRRAVVALPANRVFAFGSDSYLLPEPVVAHLAIARRNVALALSRCVEDGFCSHPSALEIARLWLHDNPREFYRLP